MWFEIVYTDENASHSKFVETKKKNITNPDFINAYRDLDSVSTVSIYEIDFDTMKRGKLINEFDSIVSESKEFLRMLSGFFHGDNSEKTFKLE